VAGGGNTRVSTEVWRRIVNEEKTQPNTCEELEQPQPESTCGLPAVLTVEETAAFLRLNVKTVHASIAAGEMPARKVGRRTVVLRDALLDWLRGQGRAPRNRRVVR